MPEYPKIISEGRRSGMSEKEKAIENLNTAKLILCSQQMLTPEMCVRIGQAITSSIDLLKEQEKRINELEEKLRIDIPSKERNDNFDLYDTPIFGFHD